LYKGGGYTYYNLNDISMTDANNCTAVGNSGLILRTTDGGNNWIQQTSGTSYSLYGVSFYDNNNGMAVGSGANSTILKTTNGGNTWTEQISPSSLDLMDVCYTDINNATAVGLNGTIIRTTNGGGTVSVKEINSKTIPNDYILYQNYPNPFNPTTTINFSVPKQSNITIKIYDALGRELNTLINGEKSAGNYSIEFNSSNLPSGIYFYRLKTAEFMQTKKMILLK
jgi:hypothetical protein